VGKKVVETGGVRLRSRIIEKPVEETIRLREEHVNVERRKVDREATDADFNNFKDETIEVREHGEVPVVNKNVKVVEEVSVNKTVDQREETIRDNVRRKEVDVENVAANNTRSDR
jgi:stress response protein YsnF